MMSRSHWFYNRISVFSQKRAVFKGDLSKFPWEVCPHFCGRFIHKIMGDLSKKVFYSVIHVANGPSSCPRIKNFSNS